MKKIKFHEEKNVISERLKVIRIEKNLTQGQLAAKMQVLGVNIDQQMISKIEHNTRIVTDYELACFCKVLQVELGEMLCYFYEKYGEGQDGVSGTAVPFK